MIAMEELAILLFFETVFYTVAISVVPN